MNVLYLLVPAALVLAGLGVFAFAWAVRTGQFDDTTTPAIRALIDESDPERPLILSPPENPEEK